MLHGVEPATHRDLLLSVGSHRGTRPLSPTEVAEALKSALDAGTPLKDLAAALHLNGPSMITRFIRLLSLPPAVLHLVDWGQTGATISFTSASELSRLKTTADQAVLAQSAIESTLSSSEVKAAVQLRHRSKKSIQDCINEIVALRGEVIRRNVLIGAVTSPEATASLSSMHQVQRDALFQSALGVLLTETSEVSGRLGVDRFTITTENKEVATQIMNLPGGFETAVTEAIATRLKEAAGTHE